MQVKCKHCNTSSESDKWNKETTKQCGEGITGIEEGLTNNNWYYICPKCGQLCYRNDRE